MDDVTSNGTIGDSDEFCCKLVSDEVRIVTEIVNYIVLSGIIGLFGVVANGFNIAVFLRQGLQESANISLFSLSCTDLAISFFTFLSGVAAALEKVLPVGPVDINAVLLLVIANPLLYVTKLSMVTTMFLCFERCLCVIRPLTVRTIITRKRTLIVLCLFYLEVSIMAATFFSIDELIWQFDPGYNMSRLKLKEKPWKTLIRQLHQTINSSFLMTFCVVVVLVSSIVMAAGVYKAAKRRSKLTATAGSATDTQDDISQKDVRIMKVVIYIAFLFLLSYLPMMAIEFVEAFIEPGLDMFGKYHNLNQVVWSIVTVLGVVSAAGNIFIYYLISERYKNVFLAIWNKEPPK